MAVFSAPSLSAQQPAARTLPPPFPMPEIVPPTFPDRDFSIGDFGAVADGQTLNTQAIARAVEACAKAGGGRVVIPDGIWLTGPIHLRSNVNLHLADKAVVNFSDRFEDFLPAVRVLRGGVEAFSYSPLIYAKDCENIAITGKGTLDGRGDIWWKEMKAAEREGGALQRLFDMSARGVPAEQRIFDTRQSGLRPHFIQPMDCKNILLEGFTLRDGPAWNINPVRCENLTIRHLTVIGRGPNNDGIDPEMCRNVLIEDCFIDTGDDCIAIKSGRDEEAGRMNRPTENVIIRRVRTAAGHGGIVIGSEISGGVRNVFVYDCHFSGTDVGIRIKTNPGRGGFLEDFWFQDITMDGIRDQAIIVTMIYNFGFLSATDTRTKIRGLHFKNIASEGSQKGIVVLGDEKLPPVDIAFENVRSKGPGGFTCTDARDVRLQGVKLEEDAAAFVFHQSRQVVLRDVKAAAAPLLTISGERSAGFSLTGLASGQIVYKDGAEPDKNPHP